VNDAIRPSSKTVWSGGQSTCDPRARAVAALIDLQGDVECAAALITFRRHAMDPDRVLYNYRMADEHVRHGLDYFIPHSPDFRQVVAAPHDLLDWSGIPSFRETATARDFLLSAGYQQGVSFLLLSQERAVGTLHLNVRYTAVFDDAELQALDGARDAIQREVGAFVRAGDLGLTPRELDVLNLVSWGATNGQISASLHLSRSTVGTHVEHILHKLGASNRVQAVRTALGLELVDEKQPQISVT
jgi:DNA-binding CsgD family transcriptional regulator